MFYVKWHINVCYQELLSQVGKLKKLTNILLYIDQIMNEDRLGVAEIKYREFQKKSIVAASTLKKGSTVEADDIVFMRAETLGFSPAQIDVVIGKTLLKDIDAFETITEDSLS